MVELFVVILNKVLLYGQKFYYIYGTAKIIMHLMCLPVSAVNASSSLQLLVLLAKLFSLVL